VVKDGSRGKACQKASAKGSEMCVNSRVHRDSGKHGYMWNGAKGDEGDTLKRRLWRYGSTM
jgi:hypothetical protein